MRDANMLAFEDAGFEVAGRKIEVIVADSGGHASMAIDGARKLVEHDKVCTILGPITGDEKIAVADYMSKVGVPHLNTSPCPWPILMMPWSIAGGGLEQQFCSAAGKYAAEVMHYKTLTAITSDANFARDFVTAFKAAFEAGGGKIIQEQYAPFPGNDFGSFLTNLKDNDAVAAWFQGSDSILFLTQVYEFGIRQRMPIYAIYFGNFMQSYLLSEMPKDAADACIGEITTTPYTPFIDTDVNRKFVAEYRQKFGVTPDDTGSTPYDGGNILLHALEANGSNTTPESLREAILNVDFLGVQGRVIFDKSLECRIRDVYVCKVDYVDGEYTWVPVFTYKDVPPAGFAPIPSPPPGAGPLPPPGS